VVTDDRSTPPPLAPGMALFLDFDGTLAALAPRPEAVVVGAWLVPALQRLRPLLGGALALVSGRPIAQLDDFLAPLRLPAAGVHGVERRDASGRARVLAGTPPDDVVFCAERLAARHPGLLLERKPSALALHYRAVPHLAEPCATALLAAVRPHADWVALLGKCVVEIKPRRATKAQAVQDFLAAPPFAGRVPVFVGDDATDEDGFTAVQATGGWGVKVGDGASGARFRLADTDAVRDWLLAALPPGAASGEAPEESLPAAVLSAALLGGLA
jgi:trehalose 6-phosphate phosphatase